MTGVEIKALRKQAGLKQGELARKAGVATAVVCHIEQGVCKPRKSTLRCIMQVLDSRESPTLTNGDRLRRKIISDEDLIAGGKIACAGTCHRCKKDWLRQPYAEKE